MLLPDGFKNTISKAFYDKTINVLERNEATETDGGRGDVVTTVKSGFRGNVRFMMFGEVLDEQGLKYEADAVITCPTNTEIELEDVVSYKNVNYFVKAVLPFDSHFKGIGRQMASVQVARVVGVGRLTLKLKKIANLKYNKPMKKAVALVLSHAKNHVAVDEGTLRSSITGEVKQQGKVLIGRVFTGVEHAPYVEFGTGQKGSGTYPYTPDGLGNITYRPTAWVYYDEKLKKFIYTTGQVAQPYMYPALKRNQKRIKKIFSNYQKKELSKLAIKGRR